jgi:hypothetical protein
MSGEWPKFKVFAVQDGDTYGLLIKRQMSADAPEEQKYFYSREVGGLAPTSEIKIACDQCHELSPSMYEKRLVEVLIDYACDVHHTGNLRLVKSIGGRFHSRKGYQGLVDHFFEREGESSLRKFFCGPSIFKHKVIQKIRGRDELVGRAVTFGVLSPHGVTFGGFDYLKPIEQVLRMDMDDQPKWFRKTGPIAADFEDGRIYNRSKLFDDLKELVMQNHLSMLIGVAATGKTVLVRQFGHDLSINDNQPVYYFHNTVWRDFDESKLVKEINHINGVIILEDIHLETKKFQSLRSRLKYIAVSSYCLL